MSLSEEQKRLNLNNCYRVNEVLILYSLIAQHTLSCRMNPVQKGAGYSLNLMSNDVIVRRHSMRGIHKSPR